MRKDRLIFTILLLISCKAAPKPEIVYDNHFEILNGKVKQIAEITKKRYAIDTVIADFDVHGNITQTNTKHDCDCLVKFAYKYDKNGKPTQATTMHGLFPHVYKYDKNGRVTEISQYTKELREHSDYITKQDKFFYKYDDAGYLIKCDRYLDTSHRFSEWFRYNDQHFLIEMDAFSGAGYLDEKKIYKYQAIDAKGNWLKRTVSINMDNKLFETDTNTRKITYY